jgi:hypothetical protein
MAVDRKEQNIRKLVLWLMNDLGTTPMHQLHTIFAVIATLSISGAALAIQEQQLFQ